MAIANNLVKIIKEGQAQLQLPKTVFYNPVQEFNRDLSIFVLRTYLKHNVWHHKHEEKHVTARGGMRLLDALSASGLRSIRYAKELGQQGKFIKQIVANDLSPDAVELIKKNIELNGVQDKVIASHCDAAMVLHNSSVGFDDRFHVIDLDPFGTGAQFFDAAVKSIGDAGLMMVTCTDTAVLCGNGSESCFARYGSMSLRGEFCHDAALRIILRSIESHAAVYGRYIKPLLSISVDFYVRVYIQVFSQQAMTKRSASKLSQIYQCKECKTHELQPLGQFKIKDDQRQAASKNDTVKYTFKAGDVTIGDRCKICGGHYSIGGPIWSDPIHDRPFLDLLKQELALPETEKEFNTFRRMQGLIHLCSEELEVPLLYGVDACASKLRATMPPRRDLMSALVNAGYRVSGSHTNKTAIKTDAPSTVVWDVFCQAAERSQQQRAGDGGGGGPSEAKRHKLDDDDTLAARIMSRPRDKLYDFKHNPAVETESQRLSLLRYQMNPTREWGPKPRPQRGAAAGGGGGDGNGETKKTMPTVEESKAED